MKDQVESSAGVVLSVGDSEGVVAEIEAILSSNAIERTVFVFPPLKSGTVQKRWESVEHGIRANVHVPKNFDAGACLAAFTRDGRLVAVTAGGAEEADYAAALDVAGSSNLTGQVV